MKILRRWYLYIRKRWWLRTYKKELRKNIDILSQLYMKDVKLLMQIRMAIEEGEFSYEEQELLERHYMFISHRLQVLDKQHTERVIELSLVEEGEEKEI